MIKLLGKRKNLLAAYYNIVDSSLDSAQFFKVKCENILYIGNNSISIWPQNTLAEDSIINIELVSDTNEIVPHVITNIITEDGYRLINVIIYPEGRFKFVTIYISGTLTDGRKVLWNRTLNVNSSHSIHGPIFIKSPTVYCKELFFDRKLQPTTRLIESGSSGRVLTIQSRSHYQDNILLNLKNNVVYPQSVSKIKQMLGTDTNTSFNVSRPFISVNTNNTDIIVTNLDFFKPEMVGGILSFDIKDYINNYIESNNITVPSGDKFKEYYDQTKQYTSSIVEYIDGRTAAIYPNFNYTLTYNNITYLTLSELTNLSKFTASYYNTTDTGSNIGSDRFSYLYVQFDNLSPDAGRINNISVEYKLSNTPNDFIELCKIPVKFKNILIDGNTITNTGFYEYSKPKKNTDTQYWSTYIGSTGILSLNTVYLDTGSLQTGILQPYYSSSLNNDFVVLTPSNSYPINCLKNTQYALKCKAYYNITEFSGQPKLEIYVSGSITTNEIVNNSNDTIKFGSLIGSFTDNTNDIFINFKTNETDNIKLFFIIRNGRWKIKDLELIPYDFTPNQFYTLIPIPSNIQYNECTFKFNFLNNYIPANASSYINNMYITGSNISFLSY